MPLYEYLCEGCDVTFEALVPISASNHGIHCPGCGGQARRILSAVNFAGPRSEPAVHQRSSDGRADVTSLKLPPAARLCWMDDQAAARLAAYKSGRGAEYDDTVAARNELAATQGDSGTVSRVASNSPLSDPVVFANRRKAAQDAKVAESAAIKKEQPSS
jgi:putative FmdB family regulatory protein